MDDFYGFDQNSILHSISTNAIFSEFVKEHMKRMSFEDTNSNSSLKLSTDNDSGYISHHVESSICSLDENNKPMIITDNAANVYVDEDALLEKPQLCNTIQDNKNEDVDECEEFGHLYFMNTDSYLESSVVSQKTTFSGFNSNDSRLSNLSNIIQVATPLVLHSDNQANELENDTNDSNINNTNVTNSIDNICDKNYEQIESNLQGCLMDDNYTNLLSFSSAFCNLYEKGLGGSTVPVGLENIENKEILTSPYPKCYTELKTKNKVQSSPTIDYIITTPTKSPKPRNFELSPELFTDDEVNSSFEMHSTDKIKSQKNCAQSHIDKNDRLLIARLQQSLGGLPPPPSVTIIQMSVEEMLQKIKDNEHLFMKDCSTTETKTNDGGNFEKRRSLLVNCKREDFNESDWPNLKKYRYHGLHHNRSKLHEDLEYMCVRYAERYIGAETQSSCTVFALNTDYLSPSKRRPKPRRVAKSPGNRLSHLARRSITFSKGSMQSAASSSNNSFIGSRTRQIMIDARKFEMLSKRRKSPLKIPGRSPRKKVRTPSSSAKKRHAMRLRMSDGDDSFDSIFSASMSSDASSTKRVLFQNSPEKGQSTHGLLRLFGADTSESKSSKRRTPRRALFTVPVNTTSPSKSGLFTSKKILTPKRCLFSPDKSSSSSQCETFDRKRKRLDSEDELPLKLPRTSIKLDTASNECATKISTAANGTSSRHTLNIMEQRKKKLMWAVAQALRAHNIDMVHPQFKIYASSLARVIRHFLPNLFVNGSHLEGGTTECVAKIARQHAFAVTRGKTLDDIKSEAKSLQPKPSKPSGYVGLEKILTESVEARNRGNILNEHPADSEACHSKSRRKENVERIRKVIDFDQFGGSSTKS